MTVSFLPGVPRCETCDQGVACMVIDSVWVCEDCAEVLGVSPAKMRTSEPVRVAEPQKARSGRSLLDALNSVLRDAK